MKLLRLDEVVLSNFYRGIIRRLGKEIKYKSSKISYELLTLSLLVLYLADLHY